MSENRLEGVCAFIPHPSYPEEQFLVLYENELKKATGKVPGMLSPVIETVGPGESHTQALERAIYEELTQECYRHLLPATQDELDKYKLCEIDLPPNARLYAYLIKARNPRFYYDLYAKMLPEFPGVRSGQLSCPNPKRPWEIEVKRFEVEVTNWAYFSDVLASETNPDKYRFMFRPGVLEVVKSYLQRIKNPNSFVPPHYDYPANTVPKEIFEILKDEDVDNSPIARINVFGSNDPEAVFTELKVAKAMARVGLDPSSYLQRVNQYMQSVCGHQIPRNWLNEFSTSHSMVNY